MDARALLLATAFRHRIVEPNMEAGFDQFVVLAGSVGHGPALPSPVSGQPGDANGAVVTDEDHAPTGEGDHRDDGPAGTAITYEAFCETVAACLRDGLIREPIRLPEGALQCHWHLELTPAGVAAARRLTNRSSD